MNTGKTYTVKGTLRAIRDMGLTCGRTEHGEYRVNYPEATEASAYYTEDAEDALATADYMRQTAQTRMVNHG